MQDWTRRSPLLSMTIPGESVVDYRARMALEQSHAVALRQQELAEQASELHTPEKRIRIWERLHALALPLQASPLLKLIANATGLTLEQIRDEQQRRLAAAKPRVEADRGVADPYCVLPASSR